MIPKDEILKLDSEKKLLEMNIRIGEKNLKELRIQRRKIMQKIYNLQKKTKELA
jgi:hypothetical protein